MDISKIIPYLIATSLLDQTIAFLFGFLLQRLKQPPAHSRTHEDEDRQ